mmetsp:Transcript_13186/g.28068  ORF Transcript_13186/g.28068 Transcript_13186/m.28068 type:complete len:213 (+) Transcript_13186:236-874(+)|eukprot:6204427-Pleurochrysis_carterae.AAC.2
MYESLSRGGGLDARTSFPEKDGWVTRIQNTQVDPEHLPFGDDNTEVRMEYRNPSPSKRNPLPLRSKLSVKDLGDGWKASLCKVAKAGNVRRARELLSKGADPNASEDGTTPLTAAAEQGHANVVRILLDAGALPERPRQDGATPLSLLLGHIKCANNPHSECGCHEAILMITMASSKQKSTKSSTQTNQQTQPRAFAVSAIPKSTRPPEFVS